MDEIIKKLEQAMNDYIVGTNADGREIYNNLNLLYIMAVNVERGLFEHFSSSSEEFDYSNISKVPLFDNIKIIKDFYEKMGVQLDIDELIADGTIDFRHYDYFYDNNDLESKKFFNLVHGNIRYEQSKKIVTIPNNGLITDVIVAIHELSHLRDQPDDRRNQTSDLLTESLAYAEELICVDYLSGLGYSDDMNFFKKIVFNTFYNIANKNIPLYKLFLLYKELGSISRENYEYYFKNSNGYESIINYMSKFIEENDFKLYYNAWYVMASVLGTHIYLQYKKDNTFYKNIDELHHKINDSNTIDCFKLMGLENFGETDKEKLLNSLNEIKLELVDLESRKSPKAK